VIVKAAIRLYHQCPNIVRLVSSGASSVKVFQCIPSSKNQTATQALWVRCNSCSVYMLRRLFKSLPNVDDVSFTRLGSGSYLGFVENRDCVCVRLGLVGEKISHIIPDSDGGSMLVHIYFKGEKDMRRFLSKLEGRGGRYAVDNVESLKHVGELTDMQEKTLRIAYDSGFYDVPRRTSIERLARLLGVSPHAVSETIRRAHRRLVANYLRI